MAAAYHEAKPIIADTIGYGNIIVRPAGGGRNGTISLNLFGKLSEPASQRRDHKLDRPWNGSGSGPVCRPASNDCVLTNHAFVHNILDKRSFIEDES